MSIVKASWTGTAAFTATAIGGVAAAGGPLRALAFAVAVALFVAGCLAFAVAYTQAVQRSREAAIGIAQLFFLTGDVAPPDVRRALLGSLYLQVAVALGTAIARPYTTLAAGALVPLYGLGLCGLWAARAGAFPPRPPKPRQ